MLITEPPPALISSGMPNRHPRNVPQRSSLIPRQNSSSGALTAVSSCAVEPPALLWRTSRRPNLSTVARIAAWRVSGVGTAVGVGVGRVGADRDRFVSRKVSGFLTGLGGDLSNGDFGAFAGEQNCGGTTNPVTGAGDEGYLACEPWHRSLLPDRKFRNSRRPAVSGVIS